MAYNQVDKLQVTGNEKQIPKSLFAETFLLTEASAQVKVQAEINHQIDFAVPFLNYSSTTFFKYTVSLPEIFSM